MFGLPNFGAALGGALGGFGAGGLRPLSALGGGMPGGGWQSAIAQRLPQPGQRGGPPTGWTFQQNPYGGGGYLPPGQQAPSGGWRPTPINPQPPPGGMVGASWGMGAPQGPMYDQGGQGGYYGGIKPGSMYGGGAPLSPGMPGGGGVWAQPGGPSGDPLMDQARAGVEEDWRRSGLSRDAYGFGGRSYLHGLPSGMPSMPSGMMPLSQFADPRFTVGGFAGRGGNGTIAY